MAIEFTPVSVLWAKNESLINIVENQFQDDMRVWFADLKKLIEDRLGDLELYEDIKPASLYWWIGHADRFKPNASLWISMFSSEIVVEGKLIANVYQSELDDDVRDAIRLLASNVETKSFCYEDHRPSVDLRIEVDLNDSRDVGEVADKIAMVLLAFAEIPNFPMD